jgi:hypothetical protein
MGEPILPKPNLTGAFPDTWCSLLESSVWRCGTHVLDCSKHVAKVNGIYYLHYIYSLLNLLSLYHSNTFNPIFLQVKNKSHHELQWLCCVFLLVLGVDEQ